MLVSLLDCDFYKLTSQAYFLHYYPRANARYRFINRNPNMKFGHKFRDMFFANLKDFESLRLSAKELEWLKANFSHIFPSWYFSYLAEYRFKTDQLNVVFDAEGNLSIDIEGPLAEASFWETHLLSFISECYFRTEHTDWSELDTESLAGNKGDRLWKNGVQIMEFGTRRRRSYRTQSDVIKAMAKSNALKGTSNVHFAFQHQLHCLGTLGHEILMAEAAINGFQSANRNVLRKWASLYTGQLGIALPDTFTTDVFLKDFDGYYARLYDGVRQDSGDPIVFASKVKNHYKSLGIDSCAKRIVFSDNLNIDKVLNINEWCKKNEVIADYGIGTHLTNDFPDGKMANIVIKLSSVDGVESVKLSDDGPLKTTGATNVVNYVKELFKVN